MNSSTGELMNLITDRELMRKVRFTEADLRINRNKQVIENYRSFLEKRLHLSMFTPIDNDNIPYQWKKSTFINDIPAAAVAKVRFATVLKGWNSNRCKLDLSRNPLFPAKKHEYSIECFSNEGKWDVFKLVTTVNGEYFNTRAVVYVKDLLDLDIVGYFVNGNVL